MVALVVHHDEFGRGVFNIVLAKTFWPRSRREGGRVGVGVGEGG